MGKTLGQGAGSTGVPGAAGVKALALGPNSETITLSATEFEPMTFQTQVISLPLWNYTPPLHKQQLQNSFFIAEGQTEEALDKVAEWL